MSKEMNGTLIVILPTRQWIDGFEWTPWFKLSPSTQNLCIERPVEGDFDIIMVHLYLIKRTIKGWVAMLSLDQPMLNMIGK